MDTRSHTSVVSLQLLTTFALIFSVASGCQTPFINSFLTTVSTEDLEEQFSGVSDLSASSSHLETIPLEFTFLRYAEEDIELEDGKAFVRGVPEMSRTLGEIAHAVAGSPGFAMPPGFEPGSLACQSDALPLDHEFSDIK